MLGLPVLLVVRPKGASLTLAAQLKAEKRSARRTILRAFCSMTAARDLYKLLAPMLEQETGLPVVGYLPPCRMPPLRAATWG